MDHGVADLIAFCSRFFTLEPGDVIATGTPGGVGAFRRPPLFLGDGDEVTVTIRGIGTLRNRCRVVPGGLHAGTDVVRIAYGTDGLDVEVPRDATVIRPRHRAAAPDPAALLRESLERPVAGPPLRVILGRGARVAISVCDVTRPQPRRLMLAALAEAFAGTIADDDVTVLIATGTHRSSSEAERRSMLGDEVLRRWRVIDHDARDPATLV